jgi:pSer/pThr/pTyr-binding forkhead associated (FHA) protein
MNPARVHITVYQGVLEWKEYTFERPTHCVVGRAEDCDIQLPPDGEHADVSRHHCLLEIAPPTVQVRDLGSRNGTYVNGEKIGQRPHNQAPEDADPSQFEAQPLKDGDLFRVGNTVFRVEVAEPSAVPESAGWVPLLFV